MIGNARIIHVKVAQPPFPISLVSMIILNKHNKLNVIDPYHGRHGMANIAAVNQQSWLSYKIWHGHGHGLGILG
jgi:hypothetical protein